ncbi:MAG: flagellar hook-associated protein FlgK [Caldilineaceae bacterium]|nr:flagellar hook-associated protein FlgK [Caldilineaceae bacterium]
MSGLLSGLQIGLSTLMAHQQAINVTSHNIANVNTNGYQRQRVNLSELNAPSGRINPPMMGMGVFTKGVSRYATPFIDQQIRRQNGAQNYAETTENLLRDVESVLTEPAASGIAAALDGFWQSWQDLTVAPTEKATRIALTQSAKQLTSTIREANSFIAQLRSNLDTQIVSQVNRVNDISVQIDDLNEQIIQANATAGGKDGALPLEQLRDSLLFELSGIIDFDLSFQDGGMARVNVGNYALVNDGGPKEIGLDDSMNLVWTDSDVPVKLSTGELQSLIDLRDEKLPDVLGQLDKFAVGLMEAVNSVHRNGYGIDGTTGLDFFSGEDSSTITVNPSIETFPEAIASAGEPGRIGDITAALEIAGLSTELTTIDGSNISINGYFRSVITDLGMNIQRAEASAESSRTVVEHLDDRRQAISGVSMDEEVASLIGYEKAFQAGARIINVVDEMLDQVINRMGLVGR